MATYIVVNKPLQVGKAYHLATIRLYTGRFLISVINFGVQSSIDSINLAHNLLIYVSIDCSDCSGASGLMVARGAFGI